jgi:hypothetical protein
MVHPVRAFTSIGHDYVGCFIDTWKGDCLGSSSRGQLHGALPLHQVTRRQVIKFVDPTRRSDHTTCSTRYKGMCISQPHNAVILPEPMTSRAYGTVKPTPSLSLQRHHSPQARKAILYTFLYHFRPTNPDFNMLYCFCSIVLL